MYLIRAATEKAQMAKPTPMDIGNMDSPQGPEEWDWEAWVTEGWGDSYGPGYLDLGALGKGSCFHCGEPGHFAPEYSQLLI